MADKRTAEEYGMEHAVHTENWQLAVRSLRKATGRQHRALKRLTSGRSNVRPIAKRKKSGAAGSASSAKGDGYADRADRAEALRSLGQEDADNA